MAIPTLVIGNKNYSSWSLRSWLVLRHFGVDFQEIVLPLDTPEFFQRIPSYSPTGKVPSLLLEDEALWDSLAICETANERWLAGRAWPENPKARAMARSAAAEMHSGFAALRSQLPMNCRRTPTTRHWDAAVDRDVARIQELWSTLRSRFGSGASFLCGDFSIVDAMFAPVCVRFRGYGVALDDAAENYVSAIYALPAMQQWLADAYAEPLRVEADEA